MVPVSRYIKHCSDALFNAYNETSNLTNEILYLDGMSGTKTRHLYNNLLNCKFIKQYLEIGSWKGSSFISALYHNCVFGYSIDNWSEFGGPKKEFYDNVEKYLHSVQYDAFDEDCFSFDTSRIKNIDVYLYDGDHSYESQKKAITYYYNSLSNIFIYIADDFNWHGVRDGTRDGLKEVGAKIKWDYTITYNDHDLHTEIDIARKEFWNGLYLAVCSKT